jgi:hypothetical protein
VLRRAYDKLQALPAAERSAIAEILHATKKDLPEYPDQRQ